MSAPSIHCEDINSEKNHEDCIIRVAILAEEPLGWGSGKHFFPIILGNYTWMIHKKTYTFNVKYIFDKDIVKGRLNTSEFDVLLVPGGGVGDGQAVMKGFIFSRNARKWKKNISTFIKDGGGYVGICGGAALITDLKTGDKKHRSFLERQYNKSSLGISCVASYYKSIAFPLFYSFQKNYPEKIGAIAYVFSFAPGETTDGVRIHTGGIPLDFQLCRDHPIFSDFTQVSERIRWWGGPALVVPEKPDRDVKILAKYPFQEQATDKDIKIHAWNYTGGIHGLLVAFLKALQYIKKENDTLKNVFLYTFYMAGDWKLTDRIIELDYSNKPSITAEVYPNKNKGRILLCTAHPEYMIWWNGHITEMKKTNFTCLGTGLYKWEDIAPLSQNAKDELTHTWWMVRRFVAWAAKVPDDHLPPIQNDEFTEKDKSMLLKNVFWDGSLLNQMENI
jgi:putative intracellular protease/amidase